MKHIYCYLSFLVVMGFQSIMGQVPEPMKNITTPNVSTLGEYGETPVNMYTGQPNISIPLYEIVEGDMKVPLSLRYDLSSVKPNRHPSWVGMGWNLSCGGQIRRIVRGCMDEKQAANGYAAGFYAHKNKIKDITNETKLREHQEYFMHNINVDGYELTADEFFFSFCGYSGKFYLNSDGGWTIISDDDIKVIFDEKGEGFVNVNGLDIYVNKTSWLQKEHCNRFFNQFIMITPDGTKYTFGGENAVEYSILYYSQNTSDLIPTTWNLIKVENTEGKCITLEYERGTPVCELKYTPWDIYRENLVCFGASTTGIGNSALSGYLLFPTYLKKIRTTFVTVNFHSIVYDGFKPRDLFLAMDIDSHDESFSPFGKSTQPIFDVFFKGIRKSSVAEYQTDIYNAMHWKRLYAIEISHDYKDEFIENEADTIWNKTFYFDYFRNNDKLLSYVTERKGNYKEYTYYVYGGGMAFRKYKAPDYPVDYSPKDFCFAYYDTEKISPEPIYGNEDHWGYWNGGTFKFTDRASSIIANKSSNLTYAKAETLKEIVYPTGGKSEFEYELNAYSKIVAPTLTSLEEEKGTGGGLRVSKITTYKTDGQVDKIKQYYYKKDMSALSESSGILKSKPVYESYFCMSDQLKMYELHVLRFRPINTEKAWLGLRQTGGFTSQPTNDDSPTVGYSSVFEKTTDVLGNNLGYTHYQYFNYDADIWGATHLDEELMFSTAKSNTYADPFSSRSQERGKLMALEYYDSNNKKIKSIRYKYQRVNGTNAEFLTTLNQQVIYFCSNTLSTQYGLFSSVFKTYTYSYLPSECIETVYGMNSGEIEKKTTFTYNRHKLLSQKTVYGNGKDRYKEKYLYSSDLPENMPFINMNRIHYINAIVENTSIKNDYIINSTYAKYGQIDINCYKPIALYLLDISPRVPETSFNNSLSSDGTPTNSFYKLDKEFFYDTNGNISYIKNRDGYATTYLWGFNYRYPIVEFKNATMEEVSEALSYTDLIFEPYMYLPEGYIENMQEINKNLPKSLITVYDYIPLVGIKKTCDSRGVITYYEYDQLGRLLKVKDTNGKVLNEYDYHYVKIKED